MPSCAGRRTSWGYCKSNGPDTWANTVEAARGTHQSPIDIIPEEAKYDKELHDKPLQISYTPANARKLLNNGPSIQVTYDEAGSSLEGGPLEGTYKVAQFHFHWGKADETGSEHAINGKHFAAEGHIVHYNSTKYASFADAVKETDGLSVLGFFLEPGKEHEGLKKLTDQFTKVTYKGESIELDSFDPATLLPEDRSAYWTYPGSLTTPPCYECVTWIVFKQPIEVSEAQLDQFRDLATFAHGESAPSDELHGHMFENYRPDMALNDRILRSSFEV
jgi:carbonic anhydrase